MNTNIYIRDESNSPNLQSVPRDTMIRSTKKDIVEQINDMYVNKQSSKKADTIEYLVPTKATLFGLDLRFRKIDQKLLEDKERKNASKVVIGRSKDGFNRH